MEVAYALFVALSFIWTQSRRGKGRAGTVLGIVAFLAVLWALLQLTRG